MALPIDDNIVGSVQIGRGVAYGEAGPATYMVRDVFSLYDVDALGVFAALDAHRLYVDRKVL